MLLHRTLFVLNLEHCLSFGRLGREMALFCPHLPVGTLQTQVLIAGKRGQVFRPTSQALIFKCVSLISLVLDLVVDAANQVDAEILRQTLIGRAHFKVLAVHLKLILGALGNLWLTITSYLLCLLGSRAHFER